MPGFAASCVLRALPAALLLSLCLSPALAGEKVGVAAAVKPEALSTPPGEATRTLRIGKSVLYNERIETSGSGVVQVLLLDGSTFTVGPGSDLVIDSFVYDPRKGKAALVATFSKGALRFVGGKVSKNDGGVTIKTPPGTLTVRGGIFQGVIDGRNKALFQFVFGNYLSLRRGGRAFTLHHPGNTIDVSRAGAPRLRKSTPQETAMILAMISNKKFAGMAPGKKQPFPRYYGFQPTGWSDQPFIQNWIDGYGGDPLRNLKPPAPPPPCPNCPPPISLTQP